MQQEYNVYHNIGIILRSTLVHKEDRNDCLAVRDIVTDIDIDILILLLLIA